MRVLIITYYWVPAGGSGVQRWLKFVKYLRNYGLEPVVFTVKNPKYPIVDVSLEKDVPENLEIIRTPICEPNNLLSIFNKKETKVSAGFLNSNPNFLGKITRYIRANYFIPDARKFWVKPSIKKLNKYLLTHKIDVIVTTGPPHSVHLIGLGLKKQLNLKWIADFRDPWTDIDYFYKLPLTDKSKKKHQKLEQEVLKNADKVLVIGNTMKANFNSYSKNVDVITNGYDTEKEIKKNIKVDKKFSIIHIGLMNADRNPKILWKVLSEISSENKEFANDLQIKLIGKIADEVGKEFIKYRLNCVEKIDYVPHKEVNEYQQRAQVLLLVINDVPSSKMIITGKIFEYLQAKRPILAIGPTDGDLADIIKQTNSGVIVGFKEEKMLKTVILDLYKHYKSEGLLINSKNIEKYHRKNLTAKLAEIIKKL